MIPYVTILVACVIGILPVAVWAWIIVRYNRQHEKGVDFWMKIFFLGVLSAIPASLFEIILSESKGENLVLSAMQQIWSYQPVYDSMMALVSAAFVALIEEGSKAAVIAMAVYSSKFKIHNDGLIFGALVGLAFGVTENGVYFASLIGSPESTWAGFSSIVMLRFVLSTSAHVVYSGAVGAFLAKASLAENKKQRLIAFVQALVVPVTIHMLFNWLLTTILSWLVVMLIAGGGYWLWTFYTRYLKEKDPDWPSGEVIS